MTKVLGLLALAAILLFLSAASPGVCADEGADDASPSMSRSLRAMVNSFIPRQLWDTTIYPPNPFCFGLYQCSITPGFKLNPRNPTYELCTYTPDSTTCQTFCSIYAYSITTNPLGAQLYQFDPTSCKTVGTLLVCSCQCFRACTFGLQPTNRVGLTAGFLTGVCAAPPPPSPPPPM